MIPDLKGLGIIINGLVNVSGNEVIILCKNGAILVDIREEFETAARQFGIENHILFPNSSLMYHFIELPQDKLLIIGDRVGLRSKEAVIFLKNQGYINVTNLAVGIVDWERGGYPVYVNPAEMMHSSCAYMLKNIKGKKIAF
jgi:rhodanese-related sulfurtransferase